MAKFLAEKAKETGVDQQLGPLNPYERRLVHMAVAEVPGVDDRKHRRRVLEDRPHLGAESSRQPAADPPAPRSTSSTGSVSVSIVLHHRHHRRDRHAARARRHRRRPAQRSAAHDDRAAADRAATRASSRGTRRWPLIRATRPPTAGDRADAVRSASIVTYFPGSSLVHRRRRRRDQRARQPGGAAGDRRGGDARRAPGWRSRRVHAARVSERPDRSAAGRSGRRSDRRGDAAAGARGVRSD